MTTFQVTTRHADSVQIDPEVGSWFNGGDRDGRVISDSAAVGIAGWFASPAPEDAPYTILAQTGCGHTGVLGDAIKRDLDKIERDGEDSGEWFREAGLYLEALDAWVAEQEG